MAGLVAPHGGGSLKPLALTGEALAAELSRARTLPSLRISSREKGDLVMLGIGGFTPLEGFMTRADWEGVCDGYAHGRGTFLADPDHAFDRRGDRRCDRDRRRHRADRPGRRRAARRDAVSEKYRSTRRTSASRSSARPTARIPA